MADKQKYGKLLKEMQNDILQKKGPISKTVSEMCWLGERANTAVITSFSDAYDGMTFTITSTEVPKLSKGKKKTVTYNGRVFDVRHRLGDGQFEQIRKAINGTRINLDTTERNDHVLAIARFIRTVKERIQVIGNEFPFKCTHILSRWSITSFSGCLKKMEYMTK